MPASVKSPPGQSRYVVQALVFSVPQVATRVSFWLLVPSSMAQSRYATPTVFRVDVEAQKLYALAPTSVAGQIPSAGHFAFTQALKSVALH
jgi:hypothetical protein